MPQHGVELVVLAIAWAACGVEERSVPSPQASCEFYAADGSCAGVLRHEICGERYCTEGASCVRTWYVSSEAAAGGDGTIERPLDSLHAAVARSESGDCIAVAAGHYGGGITLPAAVSLLGKGAGWVTIVGAAAKPTLEVAPGAGGVLRGVTIAGEGRGVIARGARGLRLAELVVDGARGVAIGGLDGSELALEQVEIRGTRPTAEGAFGVGLFLGDGTSGEARGCAVVGSAAQGVLVYEAWLRLAASHVARSDLSGVAVVCQHDQRCRTIGTEIVGTSVGLSGGAGLYAVGGRIALRRSDVSYTTFAGGSCRGVEISKALVEIEESTIRHSGMGLLLIESSGRVSRCRVQSNEERGVWVQGSSGPVLLEENEILDNRRAGVGIRASRGVIVRGGRIARTRCMPTGDGAGIAMIGDGLQVIDGSEATVVGVTLEGNDAVSLLVDGSTVTVTGCTISGGVAGILVQNASLDSQRFEGNRRPDGAPVEPSAGGDERPGIPPCVCGAAPDRPVF